MHAQTRQETDIVKGLAAGIAGGLVASLVMNKFQALWAKSVVGVKRTHGAQSLQPGSPQRGIARKLRKRGEDCDQDDATERLANAVSELMFNHTLTDSEKQRAGTANHYVLGGLVGGVYGIAAEALPSVTAGQGLTLGAFVWLGADLCATPALGLSKAPIRYPPRIHAYSLVSHLVFGVTAEVVRRGVHAALKQACNSR